MLFKDNDIATFKQFINVPFTFDTNNTFNGLMDAEIDVLIPVIGNTLYASLNGIVAANDTTTNPDLLSLCRRVVAPTSLLKAMPLLNVRFTQSGLKNTVSDGTTNIYQWQYRETEAALKNMRDTALNDLWKYLFTNATALGWTNPNKVVSIFNNADDFTQYYPLHQPYRMFPYMLPIIAKVEKLWIYGAIGKDFYNELVAYSGTNAAILEAIELLKNAVANYTIHKCATDLNVELTPQGLSVLFGREGDAPTKGNTAAPEKTVSALRDTTLNDAKIFIGQLKTFLMNNASVSVFPTFFSSTYYENKNYQKVDRNKFRTGVFSC